LISSRGMGAIRPELIRRKDANVPVKVYAEGGEVDKESKLNLTPKQQEYLVRAFGGGAGNAEGTGGGGRLSVAKQIAKDLELQAYLEGFGYKPKRGPFMGGITGGGVSLSKNFAEGGEVWDKPRPEKLGKSKPLTPEQKAKAKAQAKAKGQKYPSLVANMRAAKG